MIGSTKVLNTLGALVKRSTADATSVFSKNGTFDWCVTMVMPSAAYVRKPPVWSKW